MLKQSTALLSVFFLWLLVLAMPAQAYYDGDDLGYLDYVTINDQEFDNFDERQIVFYPEDLSDGAVIIRGLLEAEQKNIPVTDLHVEITMNGGKSWKAATGNSRWEYKFYPDIERGYDFSIRVVRQGDRMDIFDDYLLNTHVVETGNVYKLGGFLLTTAAAAVENKLTGEATLDLGWLSQFVPENLKKPGTDDLILNVTDLEVTGKAITDGSVVFEPDFTFSYAGTSFTLTSLTFTKDGASAVGSIVLPALLIPSAPEIAFSDLEFSPTAINYTLPLVKTIDPIKNFEIISGVYGVTLALSELSVNINSTKDIPISLASLDGSILLGSGYGGVSIPNLQLLDNQLLSYGTKAAAGTVSTVQNIASKITLPHTDFSISDLGGSISLKDKSVSLSGAFNFPAEFGGGSVTLPAATPLVLSTSGISTAGTLEFDASYLPSLDLSGFPTSLDALSLAITDNIPAGSLNGQVVLTSFADLPLDIVADINQDGLNSFRLAVKKNTYSFDLDDFATLSLTKLALGYDAGDFSVEMDGSITPTSDLVSSITGIGESLVFEGLTVAEDAISLADDLAGWHGLSGASAEIEGAILTLSHYGIGVDNNKFWLGLKGDGSLAGAQVNATARVFHDGSTELSGLDLKSLSLNFGDFLLKVESSAVDALGMVNGAEGTIAGLPDIVINKFPELFNEANELLVQLNGLKVDIANRKVSLGSVTLNPSEPLGFDLGPVQMALSGMTFSTTGAEIDGSISLAGIGLSAEDIPFEALQFGKTGFAGEIDLVSQTGVLGLEVLSGDYGFALELSELKVAVDTALPLADMVQLAELAGALQFGSGYDDLRVENLQLLTNNAIAWGRSVAVEGQELTTSVMTIPGTDFKLIDLGGSIDLAAKSVALSGKFQFPDEFGGGSVTLPAATPLVLSTNGISTTGTLVFDAGNLPPLDLSGFPTSLETLSLAIADNIPSGSLSGEVVLTSFANLPLDIAADISTDGLQSVRLAVEKDTYSFDLADFATLSLTKLALGYDAGDFSVEMDGSITPTNSLLSNISGIGESLAFEGLTIAQDAITLANSLAGWHALSGASFQVEGASLSLDQYGVGVEGNKFWLGLKGSGSLVGAEVNATARVFHDGSTELSGIDLNKFYFAFGDFSLKVDRSAVDEAGLINSAQGAIAGLPAIVRTKFPGLFNEANELLVQLNGFNIDIENRQVTLGSVTLTPPAPLAFALGSVQMQLAGMTFTTSSATIDGSINLAGLGLSVSDIPFADLYLGATGIAGDIDLIGDAGSRTVTIIEGESGFSLKLDTLSVNIDTRKSLANMVSLETFDGSLLFGSTYNDLEIPDLKLLANNAISWGKNTAIDAQASLARLTLPGGFAIGDLGGSIDLDAKSLSISGTIHLPPELNNATLTIPVDQPVTLSATNGLSTGGDLQFDPGNLPVIPIAHIDTILTGLSLGINANVISGSLAGDLCFSQFGGLKVAVAAAFNSTGGLQKVKIDSGKLKKTFNLEGFATLTLGHVDAGYNENDNFYVELDGSITPTHALLSEYKEAVSFEGLRVYKSAIEFAGDLGGWHNLDEVKVDINAASVSLKEYGVGVTGGLFWFGLKGHAEYAGSEADITATIFHDKTYDFDFGFKGLTLALGDFKLRTNAEMVDGIMSGAGFINAGFLTEYLPDNIKDPLTGEVNVSFENLGVDLENQKITSGTVELTFKDPLKPDLGVFAAVIRSVRFGFDGASVDGDFKLTSLAGIGIPAPPTNLSFADIVVSPTGFAGSVTYTAGGNPVSLPVLTGDYGVTLLLSELTVAVDTSAIELLDKLRLTDLDGSIKLGSGYNMGEDLTSLQMLADQGITWGVQQATNLEEMGEEAVKQAQKDAATRLERLSFTIPGTAFKVGGINGRLYLNDKQLKVWGKVHLPANLGGGSIGLTETSALVLSASGVSTTGEVDIDPGSIGQFGLAGFSADVDSFSFGVTSNSVSGSLAAKIKLAQFDNIPIDVTASISNKGLNELTVVAADSPVGPYNLAGFADLTLTTIGGGYTDGEIKVILDGDLALDPTVADVARTFSFSNLSISQRSISMPNIDSPLMFPASLPAFTVGDDLAQIALAEFGFTVKDNLMWIILGGDATILNQTVEGSILISHKGDIDLGTLRADDIVVEFGGFRLTGALALADRKWSGEASLYLGALHSSLDPSILNSFGELPVSVSNLDIDIDSKTLNSGTINFAPEGGFTIDNEELFTAWLPSVSVGVRGGNVFGEIGPGATIAFDQGILAGYTEGLSFTGFGLANNGLQVTVAWADTVGKTMTVVPHETYGINATLTKIKVSFDSSKDIDSGMFVLGGIDGNLVFGSGYNAPADLNPGITLVDGAYTFNAIGSSLSLVQGLKLKDISGGIDFENERVSFGGFLSIPLSEGKNIDIEISDWSIDAERFSGSLAVTNLDVSAPLGFGEAGSENILVTNADLAFLNYSISSFNLGLNVKLAMLKNVNLKASLGLDEDGAVDFAVDLNSSTKKSFDVKFATLSVRTLGAGYDSSDGLYFSVDTDIEMNQTALLGGLPSDLTLDGLEVYAGKIKVNDVGVSTSFTGHKASLSGVDLTLTTLGLGYSSNKFYVRAAGEITVASLCEGGADITLYDDGNFTANDIRIAMTNPAMTIKGDLTLYKAGFSATLDVLVGDTLPLSGSLMLGRGDIMQGETVTGSFVWWRAAIKVGATLSLAPIPLNIYGLGGGVGYNVQVVAVPGEEPTITHAQVGLSLIASVDIGTTDNGNAWFGQLDLTLEPTQMRVFLAGKAWVMEGRNPTIDPHLIVELEIGGSPTIFRLAASIQVTKEVGGIDMVDVNGQVDILFAANDWHIYFGSKLQPLSVTVLHYLGGQGYLQIDRSGLAMGVRKEFNLEGSAWIFYGRLYGGGEIDVAAGIQPFYVDARGKVWIGLEAGVKVSGSKYSIISAYAELGGRFRAPPVYIGLHGIASYSLLWGTVSGTWEMTFTYPENPPEGAADGGVETVPLLAYSTPEQGATDVDRFTSINIKTNMPINEPFQYEGSQWYMLTVDNYVDREQVTDSIIVSYGQNRFIPVIGGLKSTLEVQYNPVIIYPSGQSVTYKAKLVLREWNYDTFEPGRRIKEEIVEVNFNTSSENPNFRERVYEVYPSRSTTPVYADTQIYIVSKAIQDGDQWRWQFPLEKLKFEVLNSQDEAIAGTIYGNLVTYDEQAGSRRFLTEFKPDEPLKPVRMVEDLTTGVKAPAIQLDDGSYENPFTYLSTEFQVQANGGPVSVMGGDMQLLVGNTVAGQTVSSESSSSHFAAQRALGVRTKETSRSYNKDKSGKSSSPANKQSAINMRKREAASDSNAEPEESAPQYRWFWDGDYRIQVVKHGAEGYERVFVSRFSLEVPPEGENQHPYGSTAEVVGQSITNPHFYINYTVNQGAFNADMSQARKNIVDKELRTLFWENMAREPISYPVTVVDLGGSWGQGAGTHVEWREGEVCGKFDSPYDIEGLSLPGGWGWEYIRTVLPLHTQVSIYRKAMVGCQSLEAEVAALEQQLNDYREEAFKRHSVADFRSLELRFSTAAPINWSEVDLSIGINPTFDDEQQSWPYDEWTWQLIKWTSSARCTTGEYVIRSPEDSLDHRLELIPEGDFDGQVMVGYYHYFRSLNKRLNSFGGFSIRERSLKLTNTVNVDGQEFSLKKGRTLYESGVIGRVNTSRPAGSTRKDGLTYEGTVYSDGSN